MDILGHSSGLIAPHGICSIWVPNKDEIHVTGTSASEAAESDESPPGIST